MVLPKFDEEAIARSAYLAYGKVTDFKNYAGLPMPKWEDLTPKIQAAWRAAIGDVAIKIFDSMRT
jgi:hypothetical protein